MRSEMRARGLSGISSIVRCSVHFLRTEYCTSDRWPLCCRGTEAPSSMIRPTVRLEMRLLGGFNMSFAVPRPHPVTTSSPSPLHTHTHTCAALFGVPNCSSVRSSGSSLATAVRDRELLQYFEDYFGSAAFRRPALHRNRTGNNQSPFAQCLFQQRTDGIRDTTQAARKPLRWVSDLSHTASGVFRFFLLFRRSQ